MSKTKKYICALEDADVRVRYDTAGFADLRTHPTTVKAYIKQCVHDKKVKH